MLPTTVLVDVAITLTVPPEAFATYTSLPFGVKRDANGAIEAAQGVHNLVRGDLDDTHGIGVVIGHIGALLGCGNPDRAATHGHGLDDGIGGGFDDTDGATACVGNIGIAHVRGDANPDGSVPTVTFLTTALVEVLMTLTVPES